MQVEELKARAKRVVEEVWNKGNLDVLDEAYAANVVQHSTSLPDVEGRQAYKQLIADLRNTFPDLRFTMEELIIEGDTYAARWTLGGTHKGQMPNLPIPPTGKQVVWRGCTMGHMVEDMTVEEWAYADFMDLFQQLGVTPPIGGGRWVIPVACLSAEA